METWNFNEPSFWPAYTISSQARSGPRKKANCNSKASILCSFVLLRTTRRYEKWIFICWFWSGLVSCDLSLSSGLCQCMKTRISGMTMCLQTKITDRKLNVAFNAFRLAHSLCWASAWGDSVGGGYRFSIGIRNRELKATLAADNNKEDGRGNLSCSEGKTWRPKHILAFASRSDTYLMLRNLREHLNGCNLPTKTQDKRTIRMVQRRLWDKAKIIHCFIGGVENETLRKVLFLLQMIW